MASNQRNRLLVEKRAAKRLEAAAKKREAKFIALGDRAAAVNPQALAPYNSYGVPLFVERGYYEDLQFACSTCGKEEVWRATQQKWWYEVAKGYPYSSAVRCRSCRKVEQARRDAARQASAAGRERKRSRPS